MIKNSPLPGQETSSSWTPAMTHVKCFIGGSPWDFPSLQNFLHLVYYYLISSLWGAQKRNKIAGLLPRFFFAKPFSPRLAATKNRGRGLGTKLNNTIHAYLLFCFIYRARTRLGSIRSSTPKMQITCFLLTHN